MTRTELRAKLLGCCNGIGGFRAVKSNNDRAAFVRKLRSGQLEIGIDVKLEQKVKSKQGIEIFLKAEEKGNRNRFIAIMTIISNVMSAKAQNEFIPKCEVYSKLRRPRLRFPLKAGEINNHPDIVIGKVALLLAFVGEQSDLIYDAIA